ncbi:MAG TPA: alanine--glyoxylate aminotransferase family protein [Tissierellia bacterium]|nr:alanine--glyoxylate aminotransferase family protein [Tissierellia bacterium]
MKDLIIMSAGPTSVHPSVLEASRRPLKNTDLDQSYVAFQRQTERKLSRLLHTEAISFIMLGEAMLGLDGSMASLVEPGDRVLVISNGPFGGGFHDMAQRYGAETVAFDGDPRRGIKPAELDEFLKKDANFKVATLVHCETPTGVTNDVHEIGRLLHSYGILTVVDSVSGIGGERFDFDESKVDVAIGGTQKCLSALTGLTTITLSDRAIQAIKARQVPVAGWYANFENYLSEHDGFDYPYTQSDTLVNALDQALDMALEQDLLARHQEFSQLTRDFITELGYEIYALDSQSNTVTTVLLKDHQTTQGVLDAMAQRGYMLSGAMTDLAGKAFRIGHMGNNIYDRSTYLNMLAALREVLTISQG